MSSSQPTGEALQHDEKFGHSASADGVSGQSSRLVSSHDARGDGLALWKATNGGKLARKPAGIGRIPV